jgi:hypothetical protein
MDFLSSGEFAAQPQLERFISRQPPDRRWAFTPEVCLGPAFRSLAPPSLTKMNQ